MGIELDKTYNPKDFEDKWYKYWSEKKYFHAKPEAAKKPYTIVIPPPNVTSNLHMGHGLNNTIQDILIRWRRMQGKNALWMPGTDHAGIATQNVVEKMLAKEENKTRHDFSREDFIKRVWEWKEKYGSLIITQLKKIGCSCDWDRESFTMDETLSIAVREVFVRLYKDGLIYRGKYIINWCPRCTTALSDEEVEHEDKNGALYHLRYKIKGEEGHVVVATTRPETMLGDTAVAVNPKDKRYTKLVGKTVILPIANREIPVISDDYVKMDFGTGVVKVTPAHDPNDFIMGKRHNLPEIIVMDEYGKMNENAPEKYRKMDRYACRKSILIDLEQGGYLEKKEDHLHAVGHCYRCNTVVEPYLSDQWFVKMKPLAEKAVEAAKSNTVKFYPAKYKKQYLLWMENIRDWCISRQIWWGHRIPAWYCDDCGAVTVEKTDPDKCSKCGSKNIRQDEDVLDTWFSSWLWPFSTLGWPDINEDVKYFYPGDVLVTAPEILFFWVARMIMAGLYFLDDIPFSEVYLNSTVCDEQGRKMSKSLGNGIDPLEVVEEFSADALRYTIIDLAPLGGRTRLSKEKFQNGHKFANKIWNASRYILMNLDEKLIDSLDNVTLDAADRWILSRLTNTAKKMDEELEKFRFNDLTQSIFSFIWHDFCDWYVELSKVRLYKGTDDEKRTVTTVLLTVLDNALRLLHPIMPFISEEIWQKLPVKKETDSIMISAFPVFDKKFVDIAAEIEMSVLMEIVGAARNIRGEMRIPHNQEIKLLVKPQDNAVVDVVSKYSGYIKSLSKTDEIVCDAELIKPEKSASAIGGGFELYVSLEGIIDLEKEKERILKDLAKNEKDLEKTQAKLNNGNFTANAPQDIIDKEKAKEEEFITNIRRLKENLERLS